MVVVCDTFDYEDFPVYVKEKKNVGDTLSKYSGPNMAKVMEVYNLNKPFDRQTMRGRFCWDTE